MCRNEDIPAPKKSKAFGENLESCGHCIPYNYGKTAHRASFSEGPFPLATSESIGWSLQVPFL